VNGQDPLPEGQWFYRRVYTWSLTAILLGMLGFIVWRMPPALLQLVSLWLIGLIALVVTYYLLAPSAPELARLIAELRTRFTINRSGDPQ
jgi:hypothetical protein